MQTSKILFRRHFLFNRMSSTYAEEKQVAISAVLKACHVARNVQHRLITEETATKSDKSPVTVADYAAQALISKLIFAHFDHPLVGEEDSSDLAQESQATLKSHIVQLANEALSTPLSCTEDNEAWSKLGEKYEADEWLQAIDKGNAEETANGKCWALDPIDGTKGFLRKGQYAVCLALLQDGKPVLGVMGCPNLPVDYTKPDGEKGVVFVAEKGQGAFQRSFTSSTLQPIKMSALPQMTSAKFCESVEAAHSDQSTTSKIASLLGITAAPVRMDSQAKYCSVARGDGDIYLRLPVGKTYVEKIWDHASGVILVQEAGGRVSDVNGKELDFSLGRTLKSNAGIIVSNKEVFDQVIAAVKEARGEAGKL